MYYAEVRNSDKKAQGGGLEEEHESIELVELDRVEFIRLLLDGQLRDAKTYVAGLHVLATGRLKI
jgi:ADP-ribose pyrophosphatase